MKKNWFKILAVGILIGALWDHPYSYYQLLRWTISIAGAYSSYKYKENNETFWMWIFTAITILFNPIFPIYFSKDTWQVLDLVGATVFLVSILYKK